MDAPEPLNPLAALHVFAAHLEARARTGEERLWMSPEARTALREICRMKPGRMKFPARPAVAPLRPAPEPPVPAPGPGSPANPPVSASAAPPPGAPAPPEPAPGPAEEPAPLPSGSASAEPVVTAPLTRAEKESRLADIAARAEVSPAARALGTLRDIMVFATGNPDAEIMLVGEAPGAVEEKRREPFTGPAGATLDKILKAMGLSRAEVYISNICKFRPAMEGGFQGSQNRKPTAAEMASCLEYVREEIAVIRPRVIIALGATAAEGLLQRPVAVSRIRGQWMDYDDIPLMVTFHPSYILRKETEGEETARIEKRKLWEDMLKVMDRLAMPVTDKQRGHFLPKIR